MSNHLFCNFKNLKIIIFLILSFFNLQSFAGRGTNDLLLDVNVAARGMDLNETQKKLFDNAIATTKNLPEVTADTKKIFKNNLSLVIDNEKSTFLDLLNAPVLHFTGRLHETVMGHYDIAKKWAEFDESLTAEQKLNFRGKMSGTISKTFKAMTSNSARLAVIADFSSDEYNSALNLTAEQRKVLSDLYIKTIPNIKELDVKNEKSTSIITRATADANVNFSEIPDAMLDYYNCLTDTLKIKGEYSELVFNLLNEDQKIKLRDKSRGRLKLLRAFL